MSRPAQVGVTLVSVTHVVASGIRPRPSGLVLIVSDFMMGALVCGHRVDVAGAGVNPDVGLHPEVPLVALLGLMHLRVPLSSSVLGRGRGGEQRGIHNAAAAHDPTLTFEDLVLRGQQLLPELVGLEQVAEMQQRGRVRDLLDGEVQPMNLRIA
ncbi:MAG: hypothetical protein QM650_19140 [Microlunatus sp.]